MDVKDLKKVLGEIVLQQMDEDLRDGLLSDQMPENEQQKFFTESVDGYYDAITSNPNLMEVLPDLDADGIKSYLAEMKRITLNRISKRD